MKKCLFVFLIFALLFSASAILTSCNEDQNLHSISFVTDGGSEIEPQKVADSLSEVPVTERDGYLFDGWFFDSSFTAPVTFPFSVSADVTLYAKWIKLHSIDFATNGGTDVSTLKVTDSIKEAPITKRDGYLFDGWFFDSSLTIPISFPISVKADATFYAKWLKLYSVNFVTNGASNIDTQQVTDSLEKIPNLKREGYVFGGWFSDPSLTAQVSFPYAVNSDITLYAKWLKLYSVKYITNGGTSVNTQKTTDTITNPPTTNRNGYVFEGWYLDAALTAPASFPLSINRDTTLYAKWRELYTVSFYTNGGSYVSPLTLQNAILSKPPVEPIQNGYLFDGWYLDSSLTTPVTFPLSVNRDTTLYAKWLKLTDQTTYQDCAIKLDSDYHSSLIYTITPRGFDLEKLNLEGYHMKITVTYKVRYVKDYDVLWDIGYAGSPKYEIYLLDGSGVGQINENMTTTTSQKTRTITLTRSAADLINDKITLKVSTDNIQNIIYFEDIVVTYECY